MLLTEIKGIMNKFETQDYMPLGLKKAIVNYYMCKQGRKEDCETYLLRFKSNMEVLAHYGGSLEPFKAVVHKEMINAKYTIDEAIHLPGDIEYNHHVPKAKESEAAITFLDNACDERYGQLKVDLSNQYSRKNNQYPTTLADAYTMLSYYVPNKQSNGGTGGGTKLHTYQDEESDSEDDTKKFNNALTFLSTVKRCK